MVARGALRLRALSRMASPHKPTHESPSGVDMFK